MSDFSLSHPSRRQLLVSSLAAPAALALPSLAYAADRTGVTQNRVRIGAFLPLQGGYAAGAAQMRDGTEAYFQSVNDAGGVHGRMIEWIVENDSYNPQQTMTVVRKLVDRDRVFAIVGTLGTATNLAALPFLVQRKIPLINPAANADRLTNPTDPFVFSLLPSARDMGIAMAAYALDKIGAKRVAIFYQNDPFGKDPRDAAIAKLAEHDLKIVAEATCVPTDIDVSAQAVSLRNANPDVVLVMCVTKQGALLMKEAERLGWKPRFLSHNTMADPVAYELAGDALEGSTVLLFTATSTMPTQAVQDANAIIAKYRPRTQPGYWTSIGYGGAKVFVEALRRAGPDLTRERLVAALYDLNRFEPGVLPPIEWSKESHGGAKVFGFAEWRKGGHLEVVQNW